MGTFEVPLGLNLREALRREGVHIDGTCSDKGVCGRCIVRITKGDAGRPSRQETELLGSDEPGRRLACRVRVEGDLDVSIDLKQLLEVDGMGHWKEVWDSPLWNPNFAGDGGSGYGIAVDLGTTSIATSLLELSESQPLDLKAAGNPQIPWGEDIISRLASADSEIGISEKLAVLAWEAVRDQIKVLCERNSISGDRISRIVVVANSAMHSIAIGAPVKGLLVPPYNPSRISSQLIPASALPVDLEVADSTKIYFPPLAGGYAGSDAVASLLACLSSGVNRGALLDVGTNTEIAVWDGATVAVATAPSGPAFEGGHISSGMRADEGAIWKVWIDKENVRFEVVGKGDEKGICGTGMIDAVASMLRSGILDRSGLMVAGSHPRLEDNALRMGDAGAVFLKAEDIPVLQKAKSAIYSAFEILLQELGLASADLEKIYIAGAFGSRLDISNAAYLGLLPRIEPEKYILAGNTALIGASMILLSEKEQRRRAEDLAASIKHIELTEAPAFEELFIDNLYFPDSHQGKNQ